MTSGSTLSEPPFPLFDAPSTGDRGDFRGFFAPCFGEVSRGVTGFVGTSTKPIPLTQEEVDRLGVESASEISVDYEQGDNVEITAGPLEGFVGVVESIDLEKRLVKVKVSMFGRDTSAELELSQAKPV